jgi:hypothetical protein
VLSNFIRRRRSPRDIDNLLNVAPKPSPPGVRHIHSEENGIQVIHGNNCVAGTNDIISIEEEVELPSFATRAIVFLNGWSVEYLEGDHHLRGFGTWITNSRVQDRILIWQANGFLFDKGRDDSYNWCYYYTIVAWDEARLRCSADHNDVHNTSNSNLSTQLPIVSSSSYWHKSGLFPRQSVAVVPRGFIFYFGGLDDHHLRHIAYNRGHSENTVTRRKDYGLLPQPDLDDATDKIGDGFVSWDTHAIMQDNSYRHYRFFEWNSTVGGSGVSVVQPPFTILPTRREINIGSQTRGEVTQEVVIEGLPFDVAVPMLTGWDLHYDFGDEEVKKMGVWLDDIEYKKPLVGPARLSGTLRYKVTSAFYDRNKDNSYSFKHNVCILGFRSQPPDLPAEPD